MLTDIILDFFGTIVPLSTSDSEEIRYKNAFNLFVNLGGPPCYDNFLRLLRKSYSDLENEARQTLTEFSMSHFSQTFFGHFPSLNLREGDLELFIDLYIEDLTKSIAYYPDISFIISELSCIGRLSIISNTNYSKLVDINLERMNISSSIYQIFTSIECSIRKPSPKIFEKALLTLGCCSKNAIYIGDSYQDDYLGCRNAGLDCILVDPTQKYTGLVPTRVDSLSQVITAIKSRNIRS